MANLFNIGDTIRFTGLATDELNARTEGKIVKIGGSPAKIERGEGWYELDNGEMLRCEDSRVILVKKAGE